MTNLLISAEGSSVECKPARFAPACGGQIGTRGGRGNAADRGCYMIALYAAAIFTGAALLFFIQPMFARLLLPMLGGSPAVWNTAMVFYQAALLAGYAYAHFSVARLGVRRQAAWHLALLLVPFALLPIALPAGWSPPTAGSPVPWLLALMTIAVGPPFLVVSATSPVLQKWFAAIGRRETADPYFLYAASNTGSMLALLGYPLWFEPNLRLAEQSRLWTWGYVLLVLLVGGCAVWLWRSPRPAAEAPTASPPPAAAPGTRRRMHWVLLAFVPSSLMLGVTTYCSSEIAVVPLLWVVPLALYLLTFVLVFARRQFVSRFVVARAFPILVVALVLVLDMLATQPIGALMALHLAVFFAAALLCHGELAALRPDPAHLTEFYLCMSIGGVLGGGFNALLAPLLFDSVAEYPLVLVLACWVALRAGADPVSVATAPARTGVSVGDWLWPVLLGAGTSGLVFALGTTSFGSDTAVLGLVFGLAALVCFLFSQRPLRFALGVGALLLAGRFNPGEEGRVLHAERSFFGVHRVTLDHDGSHHVLVHGMTVHGRQSLDPARRRESLAYYHRTGPVGDVLAAFVGTKPSEVAVVGLGAGTLASFSQPGQRWTYFEIDPTVLKLARDERYFTFLRDSAGDVQVRLGDARQSLVAEPDGRFNLLIVDAYSSDAIPVHLVTREALALYLRKLAPGGRLAFHISNLHLDLEPVFASLADDAGLASLTRDDTVVTPAETGLGKAPSIWLVMARQGEHLALLARDPRWQPSRRVPRQPVWTDDYSSVISVFRWQ